ncbi:MAG: hypothetical protein ACYCZO_16140 [Daejeonella sp.]
MKRNTITPEIKLLEKYDQQLRDLLMSDLKAIRASRVKMINHLNYNNTQERLMTA